MSENDKKQPYLYYIFAPLLANIIIIVSAYFLGEEYTEMKYLGLFLGVLSFGAAISGFKAYADKSINYIFAWGAIFINGTITIGVFALVYFKVGILYAGPIDHITGTVVKDLPTALYFSAVSFTTLGYGDFQPVESLRHLAAIEALLGYVFLGLIVGFVVHQLTEKS